MEENKTTLSPEPPVEELKGEKSTTGLKYAGFWIRFLAIVIDWVVLGIIGYILFGSEVTKFQFDANQGMSFGVNYTGWRTLVPMAYIFIFWIWLSATPGKLILKLKIIEKNGKKLTWQKALLRLLGYLVSGITLFIGFIWAGFDKKKQGLHDKIAKTYVVRG